jgi:ribonucleoside-triphosphate reductase (formate)
MQKFIYTLNQPVRMSQSLFTNITIFDSIFLKEVKKLYFGEDNKEFDIEFAMFIQKKFLECFNKFNKSQLFTFPVLTVQFKKDENNEIEDKEFFDYICKHNLEFANLNVFSTKNLTALSSCCRLQSQINVDELIQQTKEENTNLIGGSTLKVGSIGVTTINLPRLYYVSGNNQDKFFEELKKSTLDCIKINHARRQLIQTNIDRGKMPLYSYHFIELKSQYSTVGLNGIYETVSLFNFDIISEEGRQFGIKILDTIQTTIDQQIKERGYKINCEQIPAEATAVKLAKADKILYKQDKYALYSNQFLPLVNESDLLHRIELQALFEKYFSGGSILHVNIAEKIESYSVMKKLMSYVIKKGVQYFAINYFFVKCENGHISISKSDLCPICRKKIIEKYTRIVGFLVPLSAWQEERRIEFDERKTYRNGELKV